MEGSRVMLWPVMQCEPEPCTEAWKDAGQVKRRVSRRQGNCLRGNEGGLNMPLTCINADCLINNCLHDPWKFLPGEKGRDRGMRTCWSVFDRSSQLCLPWCFWFGWSRYEYRSDSHKEKVLRKWNDRRSSESKSIILTLIVCPSESTWCKARELLP